jgi:tetratricopeptide (TPR) repeat protein
MARRTSFVALLLALALVTPDARVSGQAGVTAPQTPAPTPDAKAFTDANKIAEPDKKIAAFEQFLVDFPDSTRKSQVYDNIFQTLVKSFPENRTKILDYADKVIESAPETIRSSGYSRVATRLVDAGILLEDAAKFTEKGLETFEAEQKKNTARQRATHLATLGRIRVKQGRTADAEKALQAAYAANPDIPSAAIGLAELAESKKDTRSAIEYWTKAALTGRLTADDRKRFETLYAKVNGSSDGLEATLDAKYKAAYPAPVHPEPYKPTAARSTRLVLAEVFTGASCPPCVSVDLAFDAAMERYARKDLAVVMYHLHIPGPDPLANKATEERAKFYNVRGVPTFAVDGGVDSRGGGDRAATKNTYERLVPQLDKALESAADGALTLDATMAGSVVKVKVTPSKLKAEGGAVKLQIALVEEMLSYSGENGVRFHPMVVRSLAGDNFGGIKVDRAAPAAADWEFDVAKISADLKAYLDDYEENGPRGKITFARKPSAIGQNLSIVAFLQDEQSKKILQSAYVKIGAGKGTSSNQ